MLAAGDSDEGLDWWCVGRMLVPTVCGKDGIASGQRAGDETKREPSCGVGVLVLSLVPVFLLWIGGRGQRASSASVLLP